LTKTEVNYPQAVLVDFVSLVYALFVSCSHCKNICNYRDPETTWGSASVGEMIA